MSKRKGDELRKQQELLEGIAKYEKSKERAEEHDRKKSGVHIVKYISIIKSRRPEIPQDVIDQASKQPTKGAAQRIIKKHLQGL